jgi:uncharacterized repeat protein (TIGR02543 family)
MRKSISGGLLIALMIVLGQAVDPLSAHAATPSADACPTEGVSVPSAGGYLRGSSAPYSVPTIAQGATDVSGTAPFCGGGADAWRTVAELGTPKTSYVGYVSFPPLPAGATYFDSSGNINFTLTGTPGALGFRLYFLDRTVAPNPATNPNRVGNNLLFQWGNTGQPASGEYTVTGTVSGIAQPGNIDTYGLIVEITGLGATSGVSEGAYDEIKTLTVKRYGTGVTFFANGGTGADVVQAGSTAAPLTANLFTRTGFGFTGWATTPGGSVVYADQEEFPFSSSATLFAQWVALPSVTFSANLGVGTDAVQYESGTAPLTANTFTREGFTFSGWNTEEDGSGASYADQANFDFSAGSDTLYAQWTAVSGPSPAPSSGTASGSNQQQGLSLAATGLNDSQSFFLLSSAGILVLLGGMMLWVRRQS